MAWSAVLQGFSIFPWMLMEIKLYETKITTQYKFFWKILEKKKEAVKIANIKIISVVLFEK